MMHKITAITLLLGALACAADSTFATGGSGGNHVTGTLWDPPRAPDGRLYIEDFNALPPNTFVRLAGSHLKTNIDSCYAAVGRASLKNGVYGSFDFSGMAWDNAGKRGWAFGGGHATSGSNGVHKLDVTRGKWVPEIYESYPGYNGYTQNDNDFLMNSTNQNYQKGLFNILSGDLSGLHDSGAVRVRSFAQQSPQLYRRPFDRSPTGFAVKVQGNPWGTAWVAAPGPEGFVTTQAGYDSIFPDTNNARPQIHTAWGDLWDGPMCSWHTYFFQAYLPDRNKLIISAYGAPNYWANVDGGGWASPTDPDYGPFNTYLSINSWGGLSASRIMYDSSRHKLWFGSHVGNSTGYWYTDAAHMAELGGLPGWVWYNHLLSYDLDTKSWGVKQLKANTSHTYWSAGTRIGDMGYYNGQGHIFDMAAESDTAADFGDSAEAKLAHHYYNEGFGAAYISDQGKLWCFAGGNTAHAAEYDIDSPVPGAGRSGSMKIPSRDITTLLGNVDEMISHATVGVYNRIQYFEDARLLVVCLSTQYEVYYCRVAPLNTPAEEAATPAKAAALTCSPNPFNPVVRFSLAGNLKDAGLKIYDCSGKLAADVTGRCEWNAAGRPSGIYYAILEYNGMQISRKLVLAK